MSVLDVSRLDQWQDFFVVLGGGAAALTGLVFVAMSMNLGVITQDVTHRYRAIGTLSGFTAGFMICVLALMGGQDHRAVGAEWLVTSVLAAVIYVHGYVRAIGAGASSIGLGKGRLVTGTALYLVEVTGAALIVAGYVAGLYIAAVALTILLAFMISGAWLLIVGVSKGSA